MMLAQITATISAIVIALGGQGVQPCDKKDFQGDTHLFFCQEKGTPITWIGDMDGRYMLRLDFKKGIPSTDQQWEEKIQEAIDKNQIKSLSEWKAMAKRAKARREADKASIWQF
jgi:hypothetical protein